MIAELLFSSGSVAVLTRGTAASRNITGIRTTRTGIICLESQERWSCCSDTGDHQNKKSKNKESFVLGHLERKFLIEDF